MISKDQTQQQKYQWLAGLIDGDGCFTISSKQYVALEITVASADEVMLMSVKQLFGGQVKLRAGSKSIRYRLHHQQGLIKLLHAINGKIRNTIRTRQFKEVLKLFNITYIQPPVFNWTSGYASGLFDSDGSVVLSVKQSCQYNQQSGVLGKIARLQATTADRLQLTIKITQKHKSNLDFLIVPPVNLNFDNPSEQSKGHTSKQSFGKIYYDKTQNGYYSWTLHSKENISQMLYYFSIFPCRSKKAHRLRLINTFYKLVNLKAYAAEETSTLKKRWKQFAVNWHKYST